MVKQWLPLSSLRRPNVGIGFLFQGPALKHELTSSKSRRHHCALRGGKKVLVQRELLPSGEFVRDGVCVSDWEFGIKAGRGVSISREEGFRKGRQGC